MYEYALFAPDLPTFEEVQAKVLSEIPDAIVEPHEDGVKLIHDGKVLVVRRTVHPLVHRPIEVEEVRKLLQPPPLSMDPRYEPEPFSGKNRHQRRQEAALRRKR